MRGINVEVGGLYEVLVSGRIAPVRLLSVSSYGGWNGTNILTGRMVRIKSARRLRRRLGEKPCPQCKKHAPIEEVHPFGMHAACYARSAAAALDRQCKEAHRRNIDKEIVIALHG